ncbi:MAG: glycosyl hydrolase family 32 [Thermoleophilia bacterium]
MPLRLDDKWLWDFWTVAEGNRLHVFYLQAGRALGNPDLRHFNVQIGHAVTDDLRHFRVLTDALAPSPGPAWDDKSTWTGSIIRHGGRWQMLYTGTSAAENGLVQRIGLATSEDLTTWTRHPGPVLEPDPLRYELLDPEAWFDQAWRDPWLFRVPGDDAVHVYVTARANTGPARGRAVIGHARSLDMVHWEVLPPVTAPMGFGQMEVPQLVEMAGRWYLLFASDPDTRLPEAGAEGTGTYFLSADSPLGPFTHDTLGVIEADGHGASYAGKVVDFAGGRYFLAWEGPVRGGGFKGTLSLPRPITASADGRHLVLGDPA